jgi:hypothetical protein
MPGAPAILSSIAGTVIRSAGVPHPQLRHVSHVSTARATTHPPSGPWLMR